MTRDRSSISTRLIGRMSEESSMKKKESGARLDGFERRFAAELQREPLQVMHNPHNDKSIEKVSGPEFIAQSIALIKGQRGSHNSDKPCLTEKVQGIYGFGPAGPPMERPVVEVPAGYLERKAVRQALDEEGDFEDQWEDAEAPQVEQV